jgi:hypothetical protein
MDMGATSHVYAISNPAKYSARQLASAKNAYEFIARMGYISFKGAADIIQRGCMKDIDFTRADLVNAQSIYGTPAATQLGQGTQRTAQRKAAVMTRFPFMSPSRKNFRLIFSTFLATFSF